MSPYLQNDLCSSASVDRPLPAGAEGWQGASTQTLWPPGTRCDYTAVYSVEPSVEVTKFFGPTKAATAAVIALILLVLAAAASRPSRPAARGAVVAIAFMALMSFLWSYGGDFPAATMGSFVAWSIAVCAVLLTRSVITAFTTTVLLPTIVFFAWVIPLFTGGLGHVATVAGIASGVLGAIAIDRTRHLGGRRLSPAKELAATGSGT